MKTWNWTFAVLNLLLGFLFPYALVGGIVLIYGFMTPPTPKQQWYGIALAIGYLLIALAINLLAVRKIKDGKSRWQTAAFHALAWLAGAAVSFALI